MKEREKFSSRLGFILISAGCAIGLGNIWRFPYITGKYGGATFLIIYLICITAVVLPVMAMELAVGRASRKSVALSFTDMEKKGQKWHVFGYFAMAGNYLLMMFYTTISGWIVAYFFKTIMGKFQNSNTDEVVSVFVDLLESPLEMIFWMAVVVIFCFTICSKGLQKGVETVTKYMMMSLFAIMIVLVLRSVTLPNAVEGLKFYLKPDLTKIREVGWSEIIFAAMGQAFFTMSIGMGAIQIFGSYSEKKMRLTNESLTIMLLDLLVAFMAGLIIFPTAFSYNVAVDSGPSLIFITLPNIFQSIAGGRFWGALFFLFMSFAAISTVMAVFENIMTCCMDLWDWNRKKAAIINGIIITVFSIPCILGFNKWDHITPFGAGTNILDLEDFILSNNILPLGALVYILFCTRKYGWGYNNFLKECNEGEGILFPSKSRIYIAYIIPMAILAIFVQGYWKYIILLKDAVMNLF